MASLQIGAEVGPIGVGVGVGVGVGAGVGAGVQLQLSDLEVSLLGGAVKESQDYLAKNDNEDAQLRQHATVAGTMKNSQGRQLKLEKSHEWLGRFVCQPPSTMGGHGGGSFVHRAKLAVPDVPHAGPPVFEGSKAAVIYGTNDKASPQLGYLLAWYKSEHSSEHKVYVEAGELSNLLNQDWCEINRKLDASSSKSKSVDKPTGATAVAEIINQPGNLAFLGACFNRLFG